MLVQCTPRRPKETSNRTYALRCRGDTCSKTRLNDPRKWLAFGEDGCAILVATRVRSGRREGLTCCEQRCSLRRGAASYPRDPCLSLRHADKILLQEIERRCKQ